MKENIAIGISSCLLGENVRYDGGHKRDHFLVHTLGNYVHWVPVCPEVEYGLPVPRESMRLKGDPDSPRLITRTSNIDHTDGMLAWAQKKCRVLQKEDLSGFIFKSRSPSSGIRNVKVYMPSGIPVKSGKGIFGGAFLRHFPLIPAEDEGRLHDPGLRENFIERVFVFKRWKDFLKKGAAIRNIVTFHADHKLLLMSHSQKHTALLGRMVAEAKGKKQDELLSGYIRTCMEALHLAATVRKHTNVLMHIMGYFKKHISGDEKKEMLEVINNYHHGLIPLIVPLVLLNHYVRKYDEPYLKRQFYLNPHPIEQMLRNHV
jgi:uncharacterized protein YbgA (DUF1722 family)/uncharacterized protein YbbK (DUF523 family)